MCYSGNKSSIDRAIERPVYLQILKLTAVYLQVLSIKAVYMRGLIRTARTEVVLVIHINVNRMQVCHWSIFFHELKKSPSA